MFTRAMFVSLVRPACKHGSVLHVFSGTRRACIAYELDLARLPCPRCLGRKVHEPRMFIAAIRHRCGHGPVNHVFTGTRKTCRVYEDTIASRPCPSCLAQANRDRPMAEILDAYYGRDRRILFKAHSPQTAA